MVSLSRNKMSSLKDFLFMKASFWWRERERGPETLPNRTFHYKWDLTCTNVSLCYSIHSGLYKLSINSKSTTILPKTIQNNHTGRSLPFPRISSLFPDAVKEPKRGTRCLSRCGRSASGSGYNYTTRDSFIWSRHKLSHVYVLGSLEPNSWIDWNRVCSRGMLGAGVNAGSRFSFTLFLGLFSLFGFCDCWSLYCKPSSKGYSAGDELWSFILGGFLDFDEFCLSAAGFLCITSKAS